MQATIDDKRDYLTKEISSKGLKIGDFLDFIKSKKENGNELENWEMDELKDHVLEYQQKEQGKRKNSYRSQNSDSDIISQNADSISQKSNEEGAKIQNSNVLQNNESIVINHMVDSVSQKPIEEEEQKAPEGNDHVENLENNKDSIQEFNQSVRNYAQESVKEEIKEDDFNQHHDISIDGQGQSDMMNMQTFFGNMLDEINCLKADVTEFSEADDLSFKLSFPEKKYAKKVVISYLIETKPFNYKVRRSASDFHWLRKMLKLFFPGTFIPPLSKNTISEATKDDKVEKKMIHYQKFLNLVGQDKLLRTCKFFYDFLVTNTDVEFQLKMQSYETVSPPKTLPQVQSTTGILNFKSDLLDDESKTSKTKENIQNNSTIFTKINKSFKCLVSELKEISKHLYDLSGLFTQLINLAKDYNENDIFIKQYEGIKDLFSELYYNNQQMAFIYDTGIKQHFKFVLKEYSSLTEFREIFDTMKTNYLKDKTKLNKKKEDLFKRDPKLWELKLEDTNINKTDKDLAIRKMLPNETLALFETKQFCCYLGCSFEMEFERMRQSIIRDNQSFLTNFCQDILNIQEKKRSCWEQLKSSIEAESY